MDGNIHVDWEICEFGDKLIRLLCWVVTQEHDLTIIVSKLEIRLVVWKVKVGWCYKGFCGQAGAQQVTVAEGKTVIRPEGFMQQLQALCTGKRAGITAE